MWRRMTDGWNFGYSLVHSRALFTMKYAHSMIKNKFVYGPATNFSNKESLPDGYRSGLVLVRNLQLELE